MAISSPEHTSREIADGVANLSVRNDDGVGAVGDDELERFRSEWRQEVKSRLPAHSNGKAAASNAPLAQPRPAAAAAGADRSTTTKGKEVDHGPVRWKHDPERPLSKSSVEQQPAVTAPTHQQQQHSTKSLSPVTSPVRSTRPLHKDREGRSDDPSRSPDRLKTFGRLHSGRKGGDAVTIYARAVEAEQGGQLNDALKLYRQAFKLDDNVDRAYTARRAKPIEEPTTPLSTDLVSASPPRLAPYSFQRTIQTLPDYEKHHHPHNHVHHPSDPTSIHPSQPTRTSPLTSLLRGASVPVSESAFLPGDEDLPIPISSLPQEILEGVLAHLDVGSIETFGSTCWYARHVTAHSEQWRLRAEKIYSRPALNPDERSMADLGKKYGGEWRTVMVEEERVRMDGCYIAVCHYIRPGAGDEWVTITHMITYHRFLRFYPDGTVISFLTTDHPSDVVPTLRPNLRAKGLHIGTYTLLPPDAPDGTDGPLPTSNGGVSPAKKRSRILISDLLEPGTNEPKYEFEMELALRETSRGKWNKLDIIDYRSINLANGEVLGLALKHQKPFYFSKVRSYQPAF